MASVVQKTREGQWWSTPAGDISLGTCFALFGGREGQSVGTGELVAKAGFQWDVTVSESLVKSIAKGLLKGSPKPDEKAKLGWHKSHAKGATTLSLEEWHEERLGRWAAAFAPAVALVELGATAASLNATFKRVKAAANSLSPRDRVRDRILRTLFPSGVPDGAEAVLLVDEDNPLRQRAAGKANHLKLGGFGPRSFGGNAYGTANPFQAAPAALPGATAPAALPAAKDPEERIAMLLRIKEHLSPEQFEAKMAEILKDI